MRVPNWPVFLIAMLAIALLPLVFRNGYALHIMILALIYAIFAQAWNLVTGFGGMKTFGHHAFQIAMRAHHRAGGELDVAQPAERTDLHAVAEFDPAETAADAALAFIGRVRSPWTNRDECPKNMAAARETG